MNINKLIPSFILRRIEHRINLQKIINNISWLFFDQILRMGVGLFIGIWVARYLGPEKFGQLNYSIAFVGLFASFAGMGLYEIVVRNIVRNPQNTNLILGTAFTVQLISSLIIVVIIYFCIYWIQPENDITRLFVSIISLTLIFKSSDVIKYWFESQVKSKYTVWVQNSVFLLIAVTRVILILNKAPLIVFVWVILAEAGLVAMGLFGVYLKQKNTFSSWSFALDQAKVLLKDSWPLILSGLAISLYVRIDQIMLGNMLGNKALGIYASAVRISEIWHLLPVIITASFFPAIIKSKKKSETIYLNRIQSLLNLLIVIAIIIALVLTFTANWLVNLLYGPQYAESAPLIMIHIWSCIFIFMGIIGNKWYLTENLQKLILYRTTLGACINIIINILLIPYYGAVGAAIATIISCSISDYFFDYFNKQTKVLFYIKTASLLQLIGVKKLYE